MPENTVGRVHTPAFLQSVAIGFRNTALIADRVSPRLRVAKQSDKYRVFGKNMLVNRNAAADWAPGTIPNAIDTRWSEGVYFAGFKKLRSALLDAETANADADLVTRLRTMYTENTTNAIEIAREGRVAALFTSAANYSASHKIAKAGAAEWNTVGGDVPLNDMDTIISAVAKDSLRPSTDLTVVIPQETFDRAIKRNTSILDKIKYTEKGVVSADLLASLLSVKEVLVASVASAGSLPETAGSDILTGYGTTYLWGDTVWIGFVGAGENDMAPIFSRSFNWTAGTNGQERRVRTYRMADEGQEGDWIEVTEAIDEKITFADAGGVITNTLS